MSDRQLKEVMSAISAAATQTASHSGTSAQRKVVNSPGISRFHSQDKLLRKCAAASSSFPWQSPGTPEPGKQRKPTKAAAPKHTYVPPTHEQNPVTARYLSAYSKPAIPTIQQALQTSYASRLRTGSTVLVQPILQSALSLNPRAAARRAGLINYADPPSGDELDVDPDTDDSEFNTNKVLGRVSSFRPKVASGYSTPQGIGTPLSVQLSASQLGGKQDLDQSYLGIKPPDRFLQAKPAAPTRYEYQYVFYFLTIPSR